MFYKHYYLEEGSHCMVAAELGEVFKGFTYCCTFEATSWEEAQAKFHRHVEGLRRPEQDPLPEKQPWFPVPEGFQGEQHV